MFNLYSTRTLLFQVSVIHVLIIFLATIAVTAKSRTQSVFIRFISIIFAILLILKMIYQIKYIKHEDYNADCDVSFFFMKMLFVFNCLQF